MFVLTENGSYWTILSPVIIILKEMFNKMIIRGKMSGTYMLIIRKHIYSGIVRIVSCILYSFRHLVTISFPVATRGGSRTLMQALVQQEHWGSMPFWNSSFAHWRLIKCTMAWKCSAKWLLFSRDWHDCFMGAIYFCMGQVICAHIWFNLNSVVPN